jgi:hypothetical protein
MPTNESIAAACDFEYLPGSALNFSMQEEAQKKYALPSWVRDHFAVSGLTVMPQTGSFVASRIPAVLFVAIWLPFAPLDQCCERLY